jgi:hypothetical protein
MDKAFSAEYKVTKSQFFKTPRLSKFKLKTCLSEDYGIPHGNGGGTVKFEQRQLAKKEMALTTGTWTQLSSLGQPVLPTKMLYPKNKGLDASITLPWASQPWHSLSWPTDKKAIYYAPFLGMTA